jgi:hypothetical protein
MYHTHPSLERGDQAQKTRVPVGYVYVVENHDVAKVASGRSDDTPYGILQCMVNTQQTNSQRKSLSFINLPNAGLAAETKAAARSHGSDEGRKQSSSSNLFWDCEKRRSVGGYYASLVREQVQFVANESKVNTERSNNNVTVL